MAYTDRGEKRTTSMNSTTIRGFEVVILIRVSRCRLEISDKQEVR